MHIKRGLFLASVLVPVVLGGCMARFSGLPLDSGSAHLDSAGTPAKAGQFEYLFSVERASKQLVFECAQEALKKEGLTIVRADFGRGCILGERERRLNDWGMVTGVYFDERDGRARVKLICLMADRDMGDWAKAYVQNLGHRIAQGVEAKRK